jgi:hypothetical protein
MTRSSAGLRKLRSGASAGSADVGAASRRWALRRPQDLGRAEIDAVKLLGVRPGAGDLADEATRSAPERFKPTPPRAAMAAQAAVERATTRAQRRVQKLWLVLKGEPELLDNLGQCLRSNAGRVLSCAKTNPFRR